MCKQVQASDVKPCLLIRGNAKVGKGKRTKTVSIIHQSVGYEKARFLIPGGEFQHLIDEPSITSRFPFTTTASS